MIHDIECSAAEADKGVSQLCGVQHALQDEDDERLCGQRPWLCRPLPLVTWSHRCHRMLPVHVHVLGRQAGALQQRLSVKDVH